MFITINKFLLPYRSITQNPDARLSDEQEQFIQDMHKKREDDDDLFKYYHFFISGVSGSGKTICAVELVKQRVAYLKMKQPDVSIEVHVCAEDSTGLKKDFEQKYLKELDGWLSEEQIEFRTDFTRMDDMNRCICNTESLKTLGVINNRSTHQIYLYDEMLYMYLPLQDESQAEIEIRDPSTFPHEALDASTTTIWCFNPVGNYKMNHSIEAPLL